MLFVASVFVYPQLQNRSLPIQEQKKIKDYLINAKEAKNVDKLSAAAANYNKAAYIYWNYASTKEAAAYFNRSLELNKQIGNTNAMRTLYTNLGLIHSDAGQYSKTLEYLKDALKINRQLKDKQAVTSSLINIAIAYNKMNEYELSNKRLKIALDLAKELDNRDLLRKCYKFLADNYKALGDNEKSYEYFNYYSAIEKHIQEKEIEKVKGYAKAVEKEKAKKEKELKTVENSLTKAEKLSKQQRMKIDLLDKEKKLKELVISEQKAELRSSRIMTYSAIAGLILIAIIAFIIFRNYRQKKKINAKLSQQNEEILTQQEIIEKKNKSITKSINYGKRIQEAMLPPAENLKKFVTNSFIYFRPRDIVSGDFYYFSSLQNKSNFSKTTLFTEANGNTNYAENDFIISAIDCTGHGVPGAFMSMIGFNLINEIIGMGITEPNEILKYLDIGIKNSLKQDVTKNRDGMDMAMCVVKPKQNLIEYAGAKNPLVYFKNGKMDQLEGDPKAIGGFFSKRKTKQKDFTKKQLTIDTETTCYIFSDGYADQLGGKNEMKFLSQNFKDLLAEIHQFPMEEQPVILDKKNKEWRGGKYPQTDDILVIGFKLTPLK
jgi:serine phosphatase RsbU (regulator of sigma subunit)